MHLSRILVPVLALLASSTAFAQSASLQCDIATLSPRGGTVVLTAVAEYSGQPSALGWTVALPDGWSLMSVDGPSAPAVAPAAGETGMLEFAYTAVPAGRTEFSMTVRYPAGAKPAVLVASVILRADGKLVTLAPTPVRLARMTPGAARRQDR